MGFMLKPDSFGVTSFVRGLGLKNKCYNALLRMFKAVCYKKLRNLWIKMIFKIFSSALIVSNRYVILGDGIKISKEGKKMPGVKKMHQSSESNSKPTYFMGHSIQSLALLISSFKSLIAVPITSNIDEGFQFEKNDKRTLLDKLIDMILSLNLPKNLYLVLDRYYCSGKFIKRLLKHGIEIVTMMKRNSVAYEPVKTKCSEPKVGRPKQYGNKIKLVEQFEHNHDWQEAKHQVNEDINIQFFVLKLFWRPLGKLVQFVFVKHPTKSRVILLSTDLSLSPLEVIKLYSYRFKIEVMFKQAIHQLGLSMYRFWLKIMKPTKRNEKERPLHNETSEKKEKIKQKQDCYNLFMQLAWIAQGLQQYLAVSHTDTIWQHFGSWLRTIRPGIVPSEKVVKTALANCYLDFLLDGRNRCIFKKFLYKCIDPGKLY